MRRGKDKVPASVAFQSKPEIALEQITAARDEGFEPGVVLADAGYGHSGPFRDGLTALGLDYIVGVQGNATVWPEGSATTLALHIGCSSTDEPTKYWLSNLPAKTPIKRLVYFGRL